MASGAVVKAGKPIMRGLLHKQIKINIMVGFVLSISAGIAHKILIGDRRKAVYAEFYKNYDIEKEFQTMRKLGLFTSCPSD